MKIGNKEISGFAALAPMAGVADRAMREICVRFGAAFTVSVRIAAMAGLSVSEEINMPIAHKRSSASTPP